MSTTGEYRIRYHKANDPIPDISYSIGMETFGDRIKINRTQRGWSQMELGQKVSDLIGRQPPYGKAAVNKWESGDTEMPPGNAVWALSQLFGIPYDRLMFGPDRRPQIERPRASAPGRKPITSDE